VKKYWLLIALLFVPVQQAQGQALLILLFGDKLSTEKFQMGINAIASASNLTGDVDASTRISWGFGALGEVNLGDPWYLQFDLTLKTPGGASDVAGATPGTPELDTLFNDYAGSLNTSYITLPVWLKRRAGSFKFGVGGQVGYLTGANEFYSGQTALSNDFTLTKNVTGLLNRWDAGVTAIADYYFDSENKMRSLRISLKYYYGLTDILKDNPGDKVTNSVFLLSLGIPVGGGGNNSDESDS